jgi:hypothetical protein
VTPLLRLKVGWLALDRHGLGRDGRNVLCYPPRRYADSYNEMKRHDWALKQQVPKDQ